MLQWISAHYGDILVLLVLGLIVGWIIAVMIRKKNKGSCCCCSGCKGCAMSGSCGKEKQ